MSLPKLMFERRGTALRPLDPWSMERLCVYAEGVPLGITITSAKRRGKNGLYWAGLALLVDNIEDPQFPTSRKLHEALLDHLGMTTKLWRIDRTFREVPDSIAFDSMEDAEFDIYFERAQQTIVDRWKWSPFDAWVAEKQQAQDWKRNWRPEDE